MLQAWKYQSAHLTTIFLALASALVMQLGKVGAFVLLRRVALGVARVDEERPVNEGSSSNNIWFHTAFDGFNIPTNGYDTLV